MVLEGNADLRLVSFQWQKNHVIYLNSGLVFFYCDKCYLMQFEGHPHSWSHDSIQQIHICKHPFISGRCDAKVPLEECMETIQKRLQAVKQINNNQ